MPAAIFLCVLLVVFFVPRPGCIYTTGTGRISLGMTKAEVIQKIGLPEKTAADGQAETISYVLERPFHDDRLFYVKFVDGKVASCEIRNQ